jgi:Ca2+-binding EF-hand superfamily protein
MSFHSFALLSIIVMYRARGEDEEDLDGPLHFSRLFDLIDSNKDGKINLSELVLYNNVHMLEAEQQDLRQDIAEIDTDGNRKVDLEEFMEYTRFAERKEEPDTEHSKQIFALEETKFKAADKNDDGFVEGDEMVGLMHPQLDQGVSAVVAKAVFGFRDIDGSGTLTMAELFEVPEADIDDKYMKPDFVSADRDGDGLMSLEEFTRFDSGLHYHETIFQALLDKIDSDRDGYATLKELLSKRQEIVSSTDDAGGDALLQWVFRLDVDASGDDVPREEREGGRKDGRSEL